MKKVTAVITTHNRLNLLKRAVESVQSQTYKEMELIVVDDGSSDGTQKWAELQGFIYIRIPPSESRGGNYARNLGIRLATGYYIAFLDDDDYWIPEKTEKQVRTLEEKGCGLVYCGRRFENIYEDRIEYIHVNIDPRNQGDVSRRIFFNIMCTTSTVLVKKEILGQAGMFDENLRFWQEYELNIRIAQITPFYYVDEPLCVYRVDKNDRFRLTNKYFEWKRDVSYINEKHKRYIHKMSLYDKIQRKIMILWDAQARCKMSGLYIRHRMIYMEWFIIAFPFRVKGRLERKLWI